MIHRTTPVERGRGSFNTSRARCIVLCCALSFFFSFVCVCFVINFFRWTAAVDTFRRTARSMQTIDERSDPASRFPRVMVFPEGTCTNQRALITFKHGPFIPGQVGGGWVWLSSVGVFVDCVLGGVRRMCLCYDCCVIICFVVMLSYR